MPSRHEPDRRLSPAPPFDHSSRSRLTTRDLPRFTGPTLFDRVARVVCRAQCLPRKELYESWEMARRIRRRFRGGRVVDVACGHALLAHLLLVLDDSSPVAVAVDLRLPPSAHALAGAVADEWPRLKGRIDTRTADADCIEIRPNDLVVSAHPCGALTDRVIDMAITASARMALLPCCHDHVTCDTGGLEAWMPRPLAIDATRVARVRRHGYTVYAHEIPAEITPQNRLLLAEPDPTR